MKETYFEVKALDLHPQVKKNVVMSAQAQPWTLYLAGPQII